MADFRRNFSDAARRYIQLSYDVAIHPDERLRSLKHAMICAILSHAGEVVIGGREKWGWIHVESPHLCTCVVLIIIICMHACKSNSFPNCSSYITTKEVVCT